MAAGIATYMIKLPVTSLFDSAVRQPPALLGRTNVVLDLFHWKQEYLKI